MFLGEDVFTTSSVEDLIDNKKSLFKKIEKGNEKPFDIVLFNVKGHLTHVGIICEQDKFLHVFEGGSGVSEVVRHKGSSWEKRVDSFWRFIG